MQRIVYGGGRIAREYGLGRGRSDLFLQWPLTPQGYADQCGADSAHLLIFDRDPGVEHHQRLGDVTILLLF